MPPIIEARHVTKVFPTRRGARDLRGKGGLGDWIRGRKIPTFEALKDIDLEVNAGESLGIIGRNGSGKSTLLSLLAGVTLPTAGRVTVRGRLASLLELGAGFHPILTGRENVYLNAGLLGMRHAQVDEVFDQIVAFSGIGRFIDQPVETYSSGMYVRIAFSVAVHVNPDIFLVDEVLSVGDEEFQRQCRRKIGELKSQGKTIVFVSHDLGIVNTLCERVVLLDKGRMIHRGTTQKTIGFYLRQVGREQGVHTFGGHELEAVQCDGRISLFRKQEEITAPDGLFMQLEAMRQWHRSTDAEWEITSRGDSWCEARGRMTRMPITLIWAVHLEGARLRWRIGMECDRAVQLNRIETSAYLPVSYGEWFAADRHGRFPEIAPSDMAWNVQYSPGEDLQAVAGAQSAVAAIPAEGSVAGPVLAKLTALNRNFGFWWANSEYVAHSRVLSAVAQFPESESHFGEGLHDLIELDLDYTVTEASIREHMRQERTIRTGRLEAEFERGSVRLRYDGQECTAFLHLYASLLCQDLWNDSPALAWRGLECDGNVLRAQGHSRRFPFSMAWTLQGAEHDALLLRIDLEAHEDFDVQEYHTSVVLRGDYTHWETTHEAGAFTEFDANLNSWQHLNKSYAVGNSAKALHSALPSVTLEPDADTIPFRMTIINTKQEEGARVLQALRPSDAGLLHFGKGRHLYFSGKVRLTPPLER